MPIVELKLNPGFDPNFWKPPPIVDPPPDILQSTKSKLCTDCQDFFKVPRPKWKDNAHKLRNVLNPRDVVAGSGDGSGEDQDSSSALRQAALNCFSAQDFKHVYRNARSQTCDLCMFVHAKLSEHPDFSPILNVWERQYDNGSPVSEYFVRMTVCQYFRRNSVILIVVTDKDNALIATVELDILTDVKAETRHMGICPYDTNTSSGLSIEMCKLWLQYCLANHTACKSNLSDSSVLPARLLDVSDYQNRGMVVLHETLSVNGPYRYLTLSHCWGQSARLRLVQSNLQDFKMGLPVGQLALTFRQAIEITHRLGLQFLWIDCLCIIQDSLNDEDWLVEASKMASIYSNSICNIAAGASSDSDGGCFRERSLTDVQLIRFERYPCPIYEGQDTTGPVFIAKNNTQKALDAYRGPLDARGWILQEQILAPRTIHFAGTQIFWECRKFLASELWVAGLPPDAGTYPVHVKSKSLLYENTLLHNDEEAFSVASPELLNHRWKSIVKLYTSRNLTKARDKLPALSGIADLMKILIQDDYIAGLWKRTLLLDLAWYVEPESRKQTWPAEYRAPSWCWPSIEGVVTWEIVIKHEFDMQCSIHHADVTPLQASATGQVKDGRLEISGLVRRCTWKILTLAAHSAQMIQLTDEGSNGWLDEDVKLYPDVEASNLPSTIILLQLFRYFSVTRYGSRFGRHRLQGLMLMPTDSTETTYRRVGYFVAADWGYTKIADNGWAHFVDGWTTMRLTII